MYAYDKLRGAMGFPIDYELGRDVGSNEKKRNAILAACKDYVVKLECVKDGAVVGFFNGFMYTDVEPLILTSGHIDGYGGADKYFACFYEGTELETRVELQLVKAGVPLGPKQTSSGIIFNGHDPDAVVFRYSGVQRVVRTRPFAVPASVGDTAFIVGFKGKEEPHLSFSDGKVSYTDLSVLHTTAYADNGYSGSPVFNGDGYIIGMVQGEEGITSKQVVVVPATVLHMWLVCCAPECPGFKV